MPGILSSILVQGAYPPDPETQLGPWAPLTADARTCTRLGNDGRERGGTANGLGGRREGKAVTDQSTHRSQMLAGTGFQRATRLAPKKERQDPASPQLRTLREGHQVVNNRRQTQFSTKPQSFPLNRESQNEQR